MTLDDIDTDSSRDRLYLGAPELDQIARKTNRFFSSSWWAVLPTVLACNQLCAALWPPIASRNYKVGEPLDRRLVIGVALVGLVGVGFGYKVAMMLPPEQFKKS